MKWTRHPYHWSCTTHTIAITGPSGARVYTLWDIRDKPAQIVATRWPKSQAEAVAVLAELKGMADG